MDIRKLQRAIVNGLEDVKAHDIVVYNTEALSPLFERVIIASGTSNRQTKALAASVRDAVKAAGAPAPRTEGEENGEWIIVDCGAAVAHIMQPAVRDYYRLEEIWGIKPVTLKSLARPAPHAAANATRAAPAPAARKVPAKPAGPKAAKQAPGAKRAKAAPSRTQAAPGRAVARKGSTGSAPGRAAAPAKRRGTGTAARTAPKDGAATRAGSSRRRATASGARTKAAGRKGSTKPLRRA